jgi:flagellar basal body L-ring protein FlgH
VPSNSKDYSEKRNFIRMFVNAKVNITDQHSGNTFQGAGINLSGSGAMFTIDKAFDVGQKLTVDISSEQSQLTPLSAKFEVIRVTEDSVGNYFIAGSLADIS